MFDLLISSYFMNLDWFVWVLGEKLKNWKGWKKEKKKEEEEEKNQFRLNEKSYLPL